MSRDNRVTASPDTLVRQAGATADQYLIDAIARIDSRLGDGYAKAHPELVVGFMQVAAIDYHAAQVNVAGNAIADAIANALGADGEGNA